MGCLTTSCLRNQCFVMNEGNASIEKILSRKDHSLIYKKLSLHLVKHHLEVCHREYLALNVYVALCYYKLDYYDVSQEVLAVYLQHFPDSAIAINLKACNHFR